MSDKPDMVTVPLEPPDSIPEFSSSHDPILFGLCFNGDYRGLYRELVKRGSGGRGSTCTLVHPNDEMFLDRLRAFTDTIKPTR